jgi:putative MATE family efflux protein
LTLQSFLRKDPDIEPAEQRRLFSSLFAVAGPIILTNFLQSLYNLTDTYFLGQLGRNEVSSPATSFSIVFMLLLFSGGFSQAGRTLISQSRGKGDEKAVNFYLGQTVSMMIAMGLVLMPLIQLFIPLIFRAMAVPAEILPATTDYLRIVMAAMPFLFMSFALQAAQQGIGRSDIPFYINLVTVGLNILLDWLLIFGIGPFPAMGVQGAAWATFIARVLNAALSLLVVIINRSSGLRLRLKHMRPDREAFKLIIRIGLPTSLGQSASALGFTVLQGIVNTYGTAVIAAFNIGNRIINLFMMPAMGFSQATAVMVGQSLGARERGKAFLAVRQSLGAVMVMITVSMTITFFWGNQVTRFFVDDPEVIEWGAVLFRLVSPSVIFFALFTVFNGAFQGSGDTRPVAALNALRLWGIRLPVAYVLSILMGIGPQGIWIGMISSNMITAAVAFALILYRPWDRKLDPEAI